MQLISHFLNTIITTLRSQLRPLRGAQLGPSRQDLAIDDGRAASRRGVDADAPPCRVRGDRGRGGEAVGLGVETRVGREDGEELRLEGV